MRFEDYQRLVDERAGADQRAAQLALELVNLRRRAALVDHLVEAIPARDRTPSASGPSSSTQWEATAAQRLKDRKISSPLWG